MSSTFLFYKPENGLERKNYLSIKERVRTKIHLRHLNLRQMLYTLHTHLE